jgi:RHS repeat-associated protein
VRFAQLLQFIAACAMALAALGAQARSVENVSLEKLHFISIDCARVWMAQAVDLHQENVFTYGESASESFNLRYPGQYFDKESGLSYNWMRSYRAQDGRYTQADPIDLAGGWNKFGYAFQNPLSNTDPTGLFVPANHNGITAEALRTAGSPCPDLPSFVALADFLPGGQEPKNAHWHAMSNGRTGESPAQANARYQQYVNDQMGSCSCAGLARALHAIQDSFSAAHAGFQPWSGGRFTPPSPAHVYKDSYPSKQTWQQAVNASVATIRRYKEQCTQCQK